jgi:hemerythrin-like domain-containing protein
LRNARLVREHKEGRQRLYQLEAARIEAVAKWAETYREFWQNSLNNLKRHLEKEMGDKSR